MWEALQRRDRNDALRDFVQIIAVVSLRLPSNKSSGKIACHVTFVDFSMDIWFSVDEILSYKEK
jgi:hypothetical protein